ncbi:uncharacterized protein LOC117125536 [Anneissia japonica]|uniref:uncharacterized protein LOC117125536 n=1 Tax=Anneissia japonica TaxID=1529436 RepID=UPI001425BABF|nr:uncharacterized protein LOC117125536 [Anneissia japonica]XP_033127949.1 uncharacterized protein LOC117125536 [Anneissia japonica]
MEGDTSENFREVLISMSQWYDHHGYIDILKVLYKDLVTEPDKLYATTKVIELFELLRSSGHLSPEDRTVLYDTINVTKPFGLEPELRKLTEKTPFDIRTIAISKFTPNRQSLIKFVESLTDNDVKKVSKLYRCEQKIDKWGLFVDLEHKGKICEENMDDFLKKITTHLIIESNVDPLGLRGSTKGYKGNKDSIQENISGTRTDIYYDFYIISKDIKWEEQVICELQKRKLKCLSRKDWQPGKYKLENLTKPIRRCTKVIVGFTSEPVAGNMEFVAATAVQQMLDNNTLNHGKLIPVKITQAAVIPDYLGPITVANGWEENFYDKLLNTLSDKDKDDQLPSTSDHQQPCPDSAASKQANEDDVIKQYLLWSQQQLCRNATRFTPATLNTRYQVDIAHMFTDLDLLKENGKKQDTKPTTLEEVLNIIKLTPACKVLIEGEGGIGKSTLLRYIAYNWATDESDETFKGKIVFLVNISSIDKCESVLDGILKQIDVEDFCLKTNLSQDPLIKRYIWNHDNDIVLLLDGLDELKDGSKSPILFFKKQNMPKCKVILTSRSDKKIDEFVNESSIHVKVNGFNAGNITNYIGKHFKYFGEPALGDALLKELNISGDTNEHKDDISMCGTSVVHRVLMSNYFSWISGSCTDKHKDVISMCKNPMLLLSVCIMWEERQHLPADKADLFKEIFRTILNQFIDKQHVKEKKISIFKNIPQKYVESMLLLGKCMYNGLKINKLSINKENFKEKEEIVALAIKLGFVYKDSPSLKSDFEEIFTAPHKLIVESLVGFYLCKLCQAAGLESECSEDMKRLLQPLDDNEWKIIRENEHLHTAKEFAIGFLGTGAGMFLNYWITNSLSTYRSLMAYFEFVKIEHRLVVEKTLIDHMTKKKLEIMPHINEICKSLRKFIHHIIPDVDIQNEHFIHIMQRFYNIRLGSCGGIDVETRIKSFCKEMSSEEKGTTLAHILIAVPHHKEVFEEINEICVNDDFKYLTTECQKLHLKYDIRVCTLSGSSTDLYVVHLLTNAPKLHTLKCLPNSITGAILNEVTQECSSSGVRLGLQELVISGNDLSSIDGSLSLLVIAPEMNILHMNNCSLSGGIMNDMIRECCSLGVNLELDELDISDNNLNSIDGSLLSLLVIAPEMIILHMNNCSLSGGIMNDVVRDCCRRGATSKLEKLYINDNNLNNIDGSLLSSLLAIAPEMGKLEMNNCSLSGAIMNDMISENCDRGIKLKLEKLDISGNNLYSIDGSLLSSLLVIAPKMSKINMNNCSLSGGIMNDMIRECYRRGVTSKLKKLDISDNNLNSIDGPLLSSLLVIAPEMSKINMHNCSLSGGIMNDMIRECYRRGVTSKLKKLDISGNNLNSIDGPLLSSLLVIAPEMSKINMHNCSLSGVIMNDMIRECCGRGVTSNVEELDINGNNLDSIDGSLLSSLLVIAPEISKLNMSNCNLSGAIMNDMIKNCCSLGVNLELEELDINGNDLSNIDGPLLSSLLVIAPEMSKINMHNCSLSGVIMNDMIRECCGRGVTSNVEELDINGNNLDSIDGSLLSSLLVIAPEISKLNMSNCNLSGAIMNDMIRNCCSLGVNLELQKLDINGNDLSNIDGSLLSSLMVIAPKMSNFNISNCNLSGHIINDMIRECCSLGVNLELDELNISDNNLNSIDGSFANLHFIRSAIALALLNTI